MSKKILGIEKFGLIAFTQAIIQKATVMEKYFDVTQRTIERDVKQLKDLDKIEFRGASKTGGYYIK